MSDTVFQAIDTDFYDDLSTFLDCYDAESEEKDSSSKYGRSGMKLKGTVATTSYDGLSVISDVSYDADEDGANEKLSDVTKGKVFMYSGTMLSLPSCPFKYKETTDSVSERLLELISSSRSNLFSDNPLKLLTELEVISEEAASQIICDSHQELYLCDLKKLSKRHDRHLFDYSFIESCGGFALKEILTICYSWAFHSDIFETVDSVPLTLQQVVYIYECIQNCFSNAMKSINRELGGIGFNNAVEVEVVKVADYGFLAARDQHTGCLRIKLFTFDKDINTVLKYVIENLISWLKPKTQVITSSLHLKEAICKIFDTSSSKSIIPSNSFNPLSLLDGMKRWLPTVFENFSVGSFLQKGLLKKFLNELEWRQRFGPCCVVAFVNILKLILEQDSLIVSYRVDDALISKGEELTSKGEESTSKEELIREEKELIREREESIIEGEESIRKGEESIIEVEESIIEGEESIIEGEESIREGEESIREESMREGEESIREGEESIREGEELIGKKELIREEESIREEEESIREEEESIREEEESIREEEEFIRERKESIREEELISTGEELIVEEESIREEKELTREEESIREEEKLIREEKEESIREREKSITAGEESIREGEKSITAGEESLREGEALIGEEEIFINEDQTMITNKECATKDCETQHVEGNSSKIAAKREKLPNNAKKFSVFQDNALLGSKVGIFEVNGGKKHATKENLVKVKMWHQNNGCFAFEKQLEREDFFRKPLEWISRKYPNKNKCIFCQSSLFSLYLTNESGLPQYFWRCQKEGCGVEIQWEPPELLWNVSLSVLEVMQLIFYWLKTDVREMIKVCNYNYDELWLLLRKLREICSELISEHFVPIGQVSGFVEMSIVKFGSFFLSCALEKRDGNVSLHVYDNLNLNELKISEGIEHSVLQSSKLSVITPFTMTDNTALLSDVKVARSPSASFIISLTSKLFGKFIPSELSTKIIQEMLDEVTFRKMKPKISSCFELILDKIFVRSGYEESTSLNPLIEFSEGTNDIDTQYIRFPELSLFGRSLPNVSGSSTELIVPTTLMTEDSTDSSVIIELEKDASDELNTSASSIESVLYRRLITEDSPESSVIIELEKDASDDVSNASSRSTESVVSTKLMTVMTEDSPESPASVIELDASDVVSNASNRSTESGVSTRLMGEDSPASCAIIELEKDASDDVSNTSSRSTESGVSTRVMGEDSPESHAIKELEKSASDFDGGNSRFSGAMLKASNSNTESFVLKWLMSKDSLETPEMRECDQGASDIVAENLTAPNSSTKSFNSTQLTTEDSSELSNKTGSQDVQHSREVAIFVPTPETSSSVMKYFYDVPLLPVSFQSSALLSSNHLQKIGFSYFCIFCHREICGKSDFMVHIGWHIKTISARNISQHAIQQPPNVAVESRQQFYSASYSSSIICTDCRSLFETEEDLAEHFSNVHNVVTPSCKICTQVFDTLKDVFQHFTLIHEDSPDLICPICCCHFPVRFSSTVDTLAFTKHLLRHNYNYCGKSFCCLLCLQKFLSSSECENHLANFHHMDFITCQENQKKITWYEESNNSANTSSSASYSSFKNDEIPRKKRKIKKIKKRTSNHEVENGSMLLKRNSCQNSNAAKHGRKQAFSKFSSVIPSTSVLKCKYPTKFSSVIPNTSVLKRKYPRRNVGEFLYKCDFCLSSFEKRFVLFTHIMNHITDRKRNSILTEEFICESMTSKISKRKNKIYDFLYGNFSICLACDYVGNTDDELLTHIICEHHNFELCCPTCGVQFGTHMELIFHYDGDHQDVKSLLCPICLVEISCSELPTSSNTREFCHHVMSHNYSGVAYCCLICHKKFVSSAAVKNHINDIHLAQNNLLHEKSELSDYSFCTESEDSCHEGMYQMPTRKKLKS